MTSQHVTYALHAGKARLHLLMLMHMCQGTHTHTPIINTLLFHGKDDSWMYLSVMLYVCCLCCYFYISLPLPCPCLLLHPCWCYTISECDSGDRQTLLSTNLSITWLPPRSITFQPSHLTTSAQCHNSCHSRLVPPWSSLPTSISSSLTNFLVNFFTIR